MLDSHTDCYLSNQQAEAGGLPPIPDEPGMQGKDLGPVYAWGLF